MFCNPCNIEMKLLRKWDMRRVTLYEEKANTQEYVALVAFQTKGRMIKRMDSSVVAPSIYLCPKCGRIEMGVSLEEAKHMIRTESDKSFEV